MQLGNQLSNCIHCLLMNSYLRWIPFKYKIVYELSPCSSNRSSLFVERSLYTCTLSLQIQNLQYQSSRISLSITIQAPLIIIPVSSTSFDAVVASLGQLRISNSFNLVLAGEEPSGSDAVVVDKMVVELSSVQLLRFESSWRKKRVFYFN